MEGLVFRINSPVYSIIIELKNVIVRLSIRQKCCVCYFLYNFTSIKQKNKYKLIIDLKVIEGRCTW